MRVWRLLNESSKQVWFRVEVSTTPILKYSCSELGDLRSDVFLICHLNGNAHLDSFTRIEGRAEALCIVMKYGCGLCMYKNMLVTMTITNPKRSVTT